MSTRRQVDPKYPNVDPKCIRKILLQTQTNIFSLRQESEYTSGVPLGPYFIYKDKYLSKDS